MIVVYFALVILRGEYGLIMPGKYATEADCERAWIRSPGHQYYGHMCIETPVETKVGN